MVKSYAIVLALAVLLTSPAFAESAGPAPGASSASGTTTPAQPHRTYTDEDLRVAFRLGVMRGAKGEYDRQADDAMRDAMKSAENILPALK